MLSATFIKSDEVLGSPYTDVGMNAWYSEAVNTLYDVGIIPRGSTMFYPDVHAQRQDMVLYLYNLDRTCYSVEETMSDEPLPFTDVKMDSSRKQYNYRLLLVFSFRTYHIVNCLWTCKIHSKIATYLAAVQAIGLK